MKTLAQLLQRKWLVLIITVIIFSFVILAIVYTRQLEQEQTFRTPLPNNKIIYQWYCLNCGFLDAEEVTYDECCSLCENKL